MARKIHHAKIRHDRNLHNHLPRNAGTKRPTHLATMSVFRSLLRVKQTTGRFAKMDTKTLSVKSAEE